MSDILQAIGDVRAMARQAQSLAQVVDALDKLGSLEQAANEIETRTLKLRKEQDKAAKKLADMQADVDAASTKANEIAQGAQSEADRVIAAAKAEAESIVAEAQTSATAIVESSAQFNAEFEQAKVAAKTVMDSLDAEVKDKQKTLDDLTKKLDALRAKLG